MLSITFHDLIPVNDLHIDYTCSVSSTIRLNCSLRLSELHNVYMPMLIDIKLQVCTKLATNALGASFLDLICYLCLSLPYRHVCSVQPCGHRLVKVWPLGSLVCDNSCVFCHFTIRLPWSGVVLDCIDF